MTERKRLPGATFRAAAAIAVFFLLGAWMGEGDTDYGSGAGVSASVGGKAHSEGGTSRWETRGEPRYIGRNALFPWSPRSEFMPSGDPHEVTRGGTVNKRPSAAAGTNANDVAQSGNFEARCGGPCK